MIFVASNKGGNVPGGGFGCLLLSIFGLAAVYFIFKGLYWLLYWLSPGLLVLALIINWRIFPKTVKDWLKTLETQPVSALIYLGFAILAFPFFSLYMLLKAAGLKQLERMGTQFNQQQGSAGEQEEFTEFEEIESTPKTDLTPKQPVTPPELPEKDAQTAQAKGPPKPGNPYDQIFEP